MRSRLALVVFLALATSLTAAAPAAAHKANYASTISIVLTSGGHEFAGRVKTEQVTGKPEQPDCVASRTVELYFNGFLTSTVSTDKKGVWRARPAAPATAFPPGSYKAIVTRQKKGRRGTNHLHKCRLDESPIFTKTS